MILDIGCSSRPGRTDEESGDYYSVAQHWVTDTQLAEKGRLFLIADSMGSEAAGETSRHAVNRLYQLYYTYPSSDIRQSLQGAIKRLNNEIYAERVRHQQRKSVTLLAAVLYGSRLYLANVGRARAYLLHKDRFRKITIDRPAEEIVPPAAITAAEDEPSPPARSLGSSRQVLIDISSRRFSAGDTLVLCTDGLYQQIADEEIQRAVVENAKAQAAADYLADLAKERGEDDATVLIISAAGKGSFLGALPRLVSWLFWLAAGMSVLAVIVGLATWIEPLLSLSPTATPTETRVPATRTLPAILRPTSTSSPTVPATPTPVVTATRRPQPTNTLAPSIAIPTNTAAPVLYNPPRLIAPYDGEAIYQAENDKLIWQWYRQLGADELYEVRMWKEGSVPPARGTMHTGATELRFGLPLDQTGKYFWNVSVVRGSGATSTVVSLPSETRSFWWMGARSKPTPPTPTPLPPTNTPIPPTNTPIPPTPTPLP